MDVAGGGDSVVVVDIIGRCGCRGVKVMGSGEIFDLRFSIFKAGELGSGVGKEKIGVRKQKPEVRKVRNWCEISHPTQLKLMGSLRFEFRIENVLMWR